jgi:hypothetical protein
MAQVQNQLMYNERGVFVCVSVGRGDGSESFDLFRDKGVTCAHLDLVNLPTSASPKNGKYKYDIP